MSRGQKQVWMISIRANLLGLERVLRDYQTDVYAPEEPNQTPHNHTPVDWNNSEVQQRHQWPELQARYCKWPKSLHTTVSSFPFWILDMLKHTLRQSRIMAFPSLLLKALITAMNSNVLTVAPNVWSKANFLAVLVLLNPFFPSKSIVYAGNCSSRYSCHRTFGGQLRKVNNTKCMIGTMSRTKGF
jgi:hypothetical protein